MVVPPAPVQLPSQGHLRRVSHPSANDRDDNEKVPGLCTGFLTFSRGKPRKTSARGPSDEGCATGHHSNEVFYQYQPTETGVDVMNRMKFAQDKGDCGPLFLTRH